MLVGRKTDSKFRYYPFQFRFHFLGIAIISYSKMNNSFIPYLHMYLNVSSGGENFTGVYNIYIYTHKYIYIYISGYGDRHRKTPIDISNWTGQGIDQWNIWFLLAIKMDVDIQPIVEKKAVGLCAFLVIILLYCRARSVPFTNLLFESHRWEWPPVCRSREVLLLTNKIWKGSLAVQ